MLDQQADRSELLGTGDVVQVVDVVVGAGGAGAAVNQRASAPCRIALADVDSEAAVRQRCQGHSVTGEPGRHGAVEDVEAQGDSVHQVIDLTDAEQVLGRFDRQRGHGGPSTAAISSLSRPSVPPI